MKARAPPHSRAHTSEPNDKCVMATSSKTIPKSAARLSKALRTCGGRGQRSMGTAVLTEPTGRQHATKLRIKGT